MEATARTIPVNLNSTNVTENKSEKHRQIIIQTLSQHLHSPINGQITTIPIFDREHDHYQLLDLGWDEAGKRIFQPAIHVDLIDDKIWIQENITDIDIAKALVAEGVEPMDIVLGLHSQALRKFSEYAIE